MKQNVFSKFFAMYLVVVKRDENLQVKNGEKCRISAMGGGTKCGIKMVNGGETIMKARKGGKSRQEEDQIGGREIL